jgi:hypothetical protein
MREFIVTLRSGLRYTIKAERVARDGRYIALVVSPPALGSDPFDGVVALFEQSQVAVVVARDNLVAEDKGDPVDPHYVADDADTDVPF